MEYNLGKLDFVKLKNDGQLYLLSLTNLQSFIDTFIHPYGYLKNHFPISH
jgi:hypothetical protein